MVGTDGSDRRSATAILIVADVRLYREGLATSLASRGGLTVVATSASREEARARINQLRPDVVIVDMATRESLELIRDLRTDGVSIKTLAFAIEEVPSDVLDCAEAGAAGYVTADASLDDLVTAVERIARGELVCSPRIAAKLFGRISEQADRSPRAVPPSKALTGRERQVLEFIRQWGSSREIAQKLNMEGPTVETHVHNLLEKLEVATRAQAAARATLPASRRRRLGQADIPTRETG